MSEGPYKVELQYYKPSGKWYTDGSYLSHKKQLFEIWDEVRQQLVDGTSPGVASGKWDGPISVNVLGHPNEHPHLIVSAHAAAIASGKGGDDAIAFLKRAADGKHRIVSTGDLTLHQVAEAMARNMAFVDNDSCLGWVLLPWELTTAKDEQRHAARSEGEKP